MIRFGLALNITSLPGQKDKDTILEFYELGDLAEALHFHSLFVFEHHFSGYILSPAPLQTLSYFSGRTNKIMLGTSVIVLPWNQPIRIAEQICLLDILSNGRGIYCFGQGRSKKEFNHFGIPIHEARPRFIEAIKIIKGLISHDSFSFNGLFYSIPSLSIRPKAFSRPQDFFYGSASSNNSIKLMAELGLGLLTSLEQGNAKLRENVLLHQSHQSLTDVDTQTPPPILFAMISINESKKKAIERANHYMNLDQKLINRHYSLDSQEANSGFQTKQYIIGTPKDCIEQINNIYTTTQINHIVLEFFYGGMQYSEALESMTLFSEKVMPFFNTTHDH